MAGIRSLRSRLAIQLVLALCLVAYVIAFVPASIAFAETGTVTTDGLRFRNDPWGAVTASLPAGATVRINARVFDRQGTQWYYATTGWGALGWLYADFVAPLRDVRARVGIQAGHWRNEEAGYPLNTEPGARAGGLTESQVNLNIALVLARRLSVRGIAVDILPTVIPPGYRADAVIAIHSDAGPSDVRGFFVDRPRRSPVAEKERALAVRLINGMIRWTDIPYVPRSTVNSREYYGYRAVHPSTPIVLVETGCLTNEIDRATIAGNPGLIADALAGPIEAFVSQ